MDILADITDTHNSERKRINQHYRADETEVIQMLLKTIDFSADSRQRIYQTAKILVKAIRKQRKISGGIDAFMHEYDLSSEEGILLMCLAESFLRIPDTETADKLIADKIGSANWRQHLGKTDSIFVNASTWALMLTGKVIAPKLFDDDPLGQFMETLVDKLGEPVIRESVRQGMKIIARQFVMGNDIREALKHAEPLSERGYSFSYDMLGEAALTSEDAERYFHAYRLAIESIGGYQKTRPLYQLPGVSIKLSALHPRYEYNQYQRVNQELLPKLSQLVDKARKYNVLLTIDAEEANSLDLSLDLLEALIKQTSLQQWDGLGMAVQAYQKRGFQVLEWLEKLAKKYQCRLHVRLVKGAYWDAEIKRTQQLGLDGYPVFTRKVNTDVSYLACAKRLLETDTLIYPQFATHNAQTVASIIEMASQTNKAKEYEFQRLQGMGEILYDELLDKRIARKSKLHCRIYAPVGNYHNLLPYLVRRLLENGANTSFINRIQDDELPIEKMLEDPLQRLKKLETIPHPKIPNPANLYSPQRKNSKGWDLSDFKMLDTLRHKMKSADSILYRASSLVSNREPAGELIAVFNPTNRTERVGSVELASEHDVQTAFKNATNVMDQWDRSPAQFRADILRRVAEVFEQHSAALLVLLIRESGKTLKDSVAELREAVDFCHYYAEQCEKVFSEPVLLNGATGESNALYWRGRGVFVCISPWNFPLAIFTGQIVAALAAGNAVIAKPATHTPLIAYLACQLMHKAGVPDDVLQLVIGRGLSVGKPLVSNFNLAGIAFTGGLDTAQTIQRQLANRPGPIIPFIAETGGLNAMIVDSSALTEQVVKDTMESAFNSAGQRCSALRILYLQDDIADKTIHMLKGAMQELVIGDPASLKTDIGPVISNGAKDSLEKYVQSISKKGEMIYQCQMPKFCDNGLFIAPCAIEIENIKQLEGENFGPILHICRFPAENLEQVITEINESGYGLTLGIHSRINKTIDYLTSRLKVGNTYVNRNQIGAVVGVQPFGGERLSGTGPKAGGPHYIHGFATERVVTINTTAQGGNVGLFSID